MQSIVILVSLAAVGIHGQVLLNSYPVIAGISVLNSIIQTIPRSTSLPPSQDNIVKLLILDDDSTRTSKILDLIKNFRSKDNKLNLNENIGQTIIGILTQQTLVGRNDSQENYRTISKLHTNRNTNKRNADLNFAAVFDGMYFIGRWLTDTVHSKSRAESINLPLHLNTRLHSFQESIDKIDNSFKRFMDYCKNITMIKKEILLQFVKLAVPDEVNSTVSNLKSLHSLFSEKGQLLNTKVLIYYLELDLSELIRYLGCISI